MTKILKYSIPLDSNAFYGVSKHLPVCADAEADTSRRLSISLFHEIVNGN